MLEKIFLKFTELHRPLEIDGRGVTIFVGPNNSGKSLLLREVEADIFNHAEIKTKILDSIEITWPTEDQVEREIAAVRG